MLLNEKSCSEKAKFCMTPTIWHSDEIGHIQSAIHCYIMFWKRQNCGDNKRSVIAMGKGEWKMIKQSREDFKWQWNYSAWYCNYRCMLSYIYQKPENVQQE